MFTRHNFIVPFTGLFLTLFALPGKGYSQQIQDILRDTTILVNCKPAPVDLFKAMNFQAMPTNGYWGDTNGVPLINGNIFIPVRPSDETITESDTLFYFYITAQNEYCGLGRGATMTLHLRMNFEPCEILPYDSLQRNRLFFCWNDDVELGSGVKIDPFNPTGIILAAQPNADEHRDTRGELPEVLIYSSPDSNTPIAWHFDAIRVFEEGVTDTLYVSIPTRGIIKQMIIIKIHPRSRLEITYSPDVKNNPFREYDVDEDITIKVDDQSMFEVYKYYLNNKYLNDYFLGGDTTSSQIKLNAMVFSGLDDLITIAAVDTNKCFVEFTDNIVISVPFPNVFTPDGDGINDIFLGGSKYANREFVLEIFNRWGDRLYMGTTGWDGTYQNAPVPPGTYAYAVKIKGPDGNHRLIKGMVTLIRVIK